MMAFETLIVVALSTEWQILRRHYHFSQPDPNFSLHIFADHPNRAILQIGIGPDMANATLTKFFSIASTKNIFHWGLSGSLSAALPVGTLFWPKEICDLRDQSITLNSSQPFSASRTGRLLSVAESLLTAMQKIDAAQATQALAVDMESFTVATFCRQHDIAYTACRGIIDSHNEDISVFEDTQSPQGHTRYWRLCTNLLRHPFSMTLLLKFAKRHNQLQIKFLEYLRSDIFV